MTSNIDLNLHSTKCESKQSSTWAEKLYPQIKGSILKNKHDFDDGLSSCTLCNMNSFQERRI